MFSVGLKTELSYLGKTKQGSPVPSIIKEEIETNVHAIRHQDGSLYTEQQPGVVLTMQMIEVYSAYVSVAVKMDSITLMWAALTPTNSDARAEV